MSQDPIAIQSLFLTSFELVLASDNKPLSEVDQPRSVSLVLRLESAYLASCAAYLIFVHHEVKVGFVKRFIRFVNFFNRLVLLWMNVSLPGFPSGSSHALILVVFLSQDVLFIRPLFSSLQNDELTGENCF